MEYPKMKDTASYKVLIAGDHAVSGSQVMERAVANLQKELERKGICSTYCRSWQEAMPLIGNEMDFDGILLCCDMKNGIHNTDGGCGVLELIRCRQPGVPLFMLADRERDDYELDTALLEESTEYIWIFEDSPVFIAGRIHAAAERFRQGLLPPLMRAVCDYDTHSHEYSWAAPGHQGGCGFTKTPAGRRFYDFYGENLFRTDTGIERSSIGSLLDHSGAFGESEKMISRVFGSHNSYSVICGTSGSNRTVMQACLTYGDVAICDRNAHKSIEQGLMLTGALPVYMVPTRNQYGIIGPVPPSECSRETIDKKIAAMNFNQPRRDTGGYAVLTNSTYDGICCNSAKVTAALGESVDRIHFDEAWYGYARFHSIYHDHFAMCGDPSAHPADAPTVFATHSSHKLLNALSQSSYIHWRRGRRAVTDEVMSQMYMMNSTTSPLYAICVSNDIAARMMDESGTALWQEVIDEAVDFRQALARLYRAYSDRSEWFFRIWNAPVVSDPGSGREYDFADAPKALLSHEQSCWSLAPDAGWHGFTGLCENWAMLDPVKVSILTGEVTPEGEIIGDGVPAALVAAYIYRQGIVPTRSTDFQLMFLFSMGITRGKWVTLLNALVRFKELYDRNAPCSEVLPELTAAHPEHYNGRGLRDIGEKMLEHLRKYRPTIRLNEAFAVLPETVLSPREAMKSMIRGEVELRPVDELAGRISANAILPYPPGIPMMISGERFGSNTSPQLAYLRTLAAWDADFPGFEHVTEGCEVINGVYHALCITE